MNSDNGLKKQIMCISSVCKYFNIFSLIYIYINYIYINLYSEILDHTGVFVSKPWPQGWLLMSLSVLFILSRSDKFPFLITIYLFHYPLHSGKVSVMVPYVCVNHFGCYNKMLETDWFINTRNLVLASLETESSR